MRNYNMTNCNHQNCGNSNCNTCNYNMANNCNMRNDVQNQIEGDFCINGPSIFVPGAAIGMTYTPWQKFREIYEPEKALSVGTSFAELDKPFYGRRMQSKV